MVTALIVYIYTDSLRNEKKIVSSFHSTIGTA